MTPGRQIGGSPAPRPDRWLRIGLAWVLAIGLLACAADVDDAEDSVGPMAGAATGDSERAEILGPFLADFWRLPVPAQGDPPEGFSAAEAALDPETYAPQTPLHPAPRSRVLFSSP